MDIQQEMKEVLDVGSIAVLAGTWMNHLPDIAAGFTIIWVAIRIYESETIQKLVNKKKKK